MKNNKKISGFKSGLVLFLLVFCSIAGVGFVSGAEIQSFLAKQGNYAYFGLGLFFILVTILIYKIMLEVSFSNNNISSRLSENLNKQSKFRSKFNIFKSKFKEIAVFLNIFCVCSAMIAGLREYSKNIYNNNYFIFFIVVLLVIFLLLLFGVKWFSKLEFLMMIFVVFLLSYFIFHNRFELFYVTSGSINFSKLTASLKKFSLIKRNNLLCNSLLGVVEQGVMSNANLILKSLGLSVLYVFMNMFHIKPVIKASNIKFKNKKECFVFSFVFTGALTTILVIFTAFLISNSWLSLSPMPVLTFFQSQGTFFAKFFNFGLVFCLVISLVSCLLGLKSEFVEILKPKNSFQNFLVLVLSLVSALIFSILPFDFFVSKIYPLLGLINLFCFVFC